MARQLTEDAHSSKLPALVEWIQGTDLELFEDVSTKRLRARGEFARVGSATENLRVYPRTLWERELSRLKPRLEDRKCYGELDHPEDGKTKLSRASHLITKLWIEGDTVMGEAEILSTRAGQDLASILRDGGKVGISSRGYGTTRPNDFGEQVVQEDYKLVAFDFVADPADQNAYPKMVGESVDRDSLLLFEGIEFPDGDDPSDQELSEDAAAEDLEHIREDLREEFAGQIMARVAELRTVIEEEVRAELRSDEAARKIQAFESLRDTLAPFVLPRDVQAALAERDEMIAGLRESRERLREKIATLEEENEELATLARVTGFACAMEREIGGHPEAERIRSLMGDLTQYDTAQKFRAKLESVREHLDTMRLEEEEAQEMHREQSERVEKQFDQMRLRMGELEEALEKSARALHITGLQLYGERRIGKHPRAQQIREVLHRSQLRDREDVDEIIEQFRPPKRSREAIESAVSRVRRQLGGGVERYPFDEEEPWPVRGGQPARKQLREDTNFNGLGVPLDALRELMPPGADQP